MVDNYILYTSNMLQAPYGGEFGNYKRTTQVVQQKKNRVKIL